jgi:hypothetical protein
MRGYAYCSVFVTVRTSVRLVSSIVRRDKCPWSMNGAFDLLGVMRSFGRGTAFVSMQCSKIGAGKILTGEHLTLSEGIRIFLTEVVSLVLGNNGLFGYFTPRVVLGYGQFPLAVSGSDW